MTKEELLRWVDEELEPEKRLNAYSVVDKFTEGYWHGLQIVKDKLNIS